MRPLVFLIALAGATATLRVGAQTEFTLESTSFGTDASLAPQYAYNSGGCNGGNTSPELHWTGAPPATKAFAVTLFDPDAREGRGWWHWILLDIDPGTTSLPVGAGDPRSSKAPPGTRAGRNSYGDAGYSGPCPPPGETHHYVFAIYALDTAQLGVPADAAPASVHAALEGHTLASATLQATASR